MSEYKVQYSHPLWQKRRLEVMEGAGWKCTTCESTTATLNVHHRYYVPKRPIWLYPDWALVCLCDVCHKDHHKQDASVEYWEVVTADLFRGCADDGPDVIDLAHALSLWNCDFPTRIRELEQFVRSKSS